jgi:hypothetical protein
VAADVGGTLEQGAARRGGADVVGAESGSRSRCRRVTARSVTLSVRTGQQCKWAAKQKPAAQNRQELTGRHQAGNRALWSAQIGSLFSLSFDIKNIE